MRSSVRAVSTLGPADLDAWRDLAARAVQSNPLFEPECLAPAARHVDGGRDIAVAVAEEDGTWYACVPVRPARSWRAVRRPVLTTAVRRMTYDATPLVDADRPAEALAAVLRGLRAHARAGGPGLVVLDWHDDGPALTALEEAGRAAGVVHRRYHAWERPMVHLGGELDLSTMHSGKFRYNVRRMRRRLAEAEGSPVRMTDRRDAPEAVDLLLALEAGGYKGTTGVAIDANPGERQWFSAMCHEFRRQGRLRLYTLDVGPRAVAAELLLLGQRGLFLLKTVYDEAYAEYSPGIQLHLDVVGHEHDAGEVSWIDTCTYEGNDTLLRLYPDRRAVASVVVATGGLLDRSYLRAVAAARAALGRDRASAAVIAGGARVAAGTAPAGVARAAG